MTTPTVANAILRAHRQQAERIDAHPELDRRARLHEGDEQDYYERTESRYRTGAIFLVSIYALTVGLMAGHALTGAILSLVEWVGG